VLIGDLDVDVLEMDRVSEVLGGAVECLLHEAFQAVTPRPIARVGRMERMRERLLPEGTALHPGYEASISARTLARSASMTVRPFGVSTCQNVQPLHASSPCASAPIRWIEPTLVP
jgi:hypothetical protein